MRITKDYGLISSKLEHDLLASIDKSIIVPGRQSDTSQRQGI